MPELPRVDLQALTTGQLRQLLTRSRQAERHELADHVARVLDARQSGGPVLAGPVAPASPPARRSSRQVAVAGGAAGLLAAAIFIALLVTPDLRPRDRPSPSLALRGPVDAPGPRRLRADTAVAPTRKAPSLRPRVVSDAARIAIPEATPPEATIGEGAGETLLAVSGSGLLSPACESAQTASEQLSCQDSASAALAASSDRALVTSPQASAPGPAGRSNAPGAPPN